MVHSGSVESQELYASPVKPSRHSHIGLCPMVLHFAFRPQLSNSQGFLQTFDIHASFDRQSASVEQSTEETKYIRMLLGVRFIYFFLSKFVDF
jgi:hypothetical protein